MSDWAVEEFRALRLEEIDVRYARYRLSVLEAEEAMARSLRRYGQMAPIVVCLRDEVPVLVDGFKRLAAARGLKGLGTLSARRIEVDERNAKAAMYGLNRTGRHFGELEEAWLVQALVREDGLSQVEVATLLGRHKSWVCRRLAMLEKLCGEAQEDLRLGLLAPTMARQLTRLAVRFLEGLLAAQRYGWDQAQKVLALSGIYHRDDLLAALERAVRYGAFSANSVERILAVQARPKTPLERMADEEPSHLGKLLSDDPTPPRPATEYQDLLFEEPEHHDDTEEKDDGGPCGQPA